MPDVPLELPVIQNWSCHSCSGCCREHAVFITEEERQRIIDQRWTPESGIPESQPLFQLTGGLFRKKWHRLAHQPDGRCVFLDDAGLCRIHARHGENAKPLACRIYPYAFHPAGNKVAVSVRFSCPSVVANLGRPVTEARRELNEIAAQVVPERVREIPPAEIKPGCRLGWPDFLRFVRTLEATIAAEDAPLVERLRRALFWVHLAAEAQYERVQGERLGEFLELISQAAGGEIAEASEVPRPTRAGFLQFRTLAGFYARKDTAVEAAGGWRVRWKRLRAAVRFARGSGNIPVLQSGFREVPFAELEKPMGGWPDEAEEILTRYLRVKIRGLHFCGPAYYNVPFVEGFWSLALVVPIVGYLARWHALSHERVALTTEDVSRALAIADHQHGYAPPLGSRGFRRRVRLLAAANDVERLIVHYAE